MNKHRIAILLTIAMFAGLFWSRAILSIVQGAWAVFCLVQYKDWKKDIRSDRLLAWSLWVILLFLPGWYQHPRAALTYDFLLTLSVYPVAAFSIKSMEPRTRNAVVTVWCWATLAGLLYPLYSYALHPLDAAAAYGSGHSLPTFMDTDHVRFGILLCSTLVLAIAYQFTQKRYQRAALIGLTIVVVFISVRTAWLILGCLVLVAIFLNARKWKPAWVAGSLVLLIAAAWTSYQLFPTVRQKVAYSLYDWRQFTPGKYNPDFSDGARRVVNQVAYKAVRSGGANSGWAGIPDTLKQYAGVYFPGAGLLYGWPFNQWLFWCMGGGLPAMLLFTVWLLYPAWNGWKNNNQALIYWTIAILASCLVESTLALQYGVFLHAWPLALLWCAPAAKKPAAT